MLFMGWQLSTGP